MHDIPRHGWCATCDPGAKPGEPNYCGPKQSSDDPIAIASPTKNWGFCQWDCGGKGGPANPGQDGIRPKYEDGNNMYLSDKYCRELLGVRYDVI